MTTPTAPASTSTNVVISIEGNQILVEGVAASTQSFIEMLTQTNKVVMAAIEQSPLERNEWKQFEREMIEMQTTAITNLWKECRGLVGSMYDDTCLGMKKLQEVSLQNDLLKQKVEKQAVLMREGCLDLSGRDGVTDNFLDIIATNHPDLTTINLNGCTQITGRGIQTLLTKCHKLVSLDIVGCGPWLEQISLVFTSCSQISEESLLAIINCCPSLTTLYAPPNLGIAGLTNKILKNCGSHFVELFMSADLSEVKEFTFLSALSLSEASIARLIGQCSNLTHFTLYHSNFSDKCCAKLGSSLLSLAVQSSTNLSDKSLAIIAERCQKLVSLAVCNSQVTDEGLPHLFKLKALKTFHVSSTKVSLQGIKAVLQNCPITQLHIKDTSITPEDIEQLRIDNQKNLQIL